MGRYKQALPASQTTSAKAGVQPEWPRACDVSSPFMSYDPKVAFSVPFFFFSDFLSLQHSLSAAVGMSQAGRLLARPQLLPCCWGPRPPTPRAGAPREPPAGGRQAVFWDGTSGALGGRWEVRGTLTHSEPHGPSDSDANKEAAWGSLPASLINLIHLTLVSK